MSSKRPRKPRTSLADCLRRRFEKPLQTINFSDDIPKKWEKHGDLVLLPESCFKLEIWDEIDQSDLWQTIAKYFGVARIAKKGRIRSDDHRTPQVIMLKGVDTWVCHIDNKIRYCYDVTKCMFSAGNITEKMRMANLDCSDEVVVDMFAGIGYFTLPLLVHAKAKHVHALEWNPDAVNALKRNLKENKVVGRCTVYQGDNRQVCPQGVADRVLMGLIPNAMGSIEPACHALKRGIGGVLHIHHNVNSNIVQREHYDFDQLDRSEPAHCFSHSCKTLCHNQKEYYDLAIIGCNKKVILSEWLSWATETSSVVKEIMNRLHQNEGWTDVEFETRILHIEKVKSYAPHIDHMVLDLKVERCDTDKRKPV